MNQGILRLQTSLRSNSQYGVAYVWVIVSMTAIIGIIALVVDLARLQVNRQEQYYAARSLATAALYALSRNPSDSDMLARVRELAGQLKVLGDGAFSGQGDVYITNDAVDPSSGGINVTPGFWLLSPPTASSSTTCDNYPCFIPRQGSTDVPTALRVSVTSRTSSPIRSTFARFFGTDTFRTRDEAVVALSPRRLIMAVDLSRSMQGTSHLMNGVYSAEYAYRISTKPSASACASDAAGSDNECLAPGVCIEPDCFTDCTFVGPGGLNSAPNLSYNFNMARSGYNTPHVQEDYRCFHGPTFESTGSDADYLIDMHADPAPLSTALRSLDKAMESMQRSSIAGDLVGLIGFDTNAGVTTSDPLIGRKQGLYSPILDREQFDKLRMITHYNNAVGSSPIADENNFARIENGFFPISTFKSAYTNLPAALTLAKDMLSAAASNDSNNTLPGRSYVIVASDGITNCYQDSGSYMACGDDLTKYVNSRNITKNKIGELQAEGITLVFMLFYGQTGPNTLLIPKGGGSPDCLTDQEARDRGFDYVDSSPAPQNGSVEEEFAGSQRSENYFYDPNSFYNTIRPAGGIWVPIRPCYIENGRCVNLFDWETNAKNGRPTNCEELRKDSRFAIKKGENYRMTFDPNGRTPEEQAFEAIDLIMQDVNITTVAHQRY